MSEFGNIVIRITTAFALLSAWIVVSLTATATESSSERAELSAEGRET